MLDLPGSRPKRDPEVIARLKAWAVEQFRPGEGAAVMVTELRCTEPGCPPLETVIAVLRDGEPARQYKVHKPMDQVTPEDLSACVEHHDHH